MNQFGQIPPLHLATASAPFAAIAPDKIAPLKDGRAYNLVFEKG